MKIKSIRIENFKSILDQTVDLFTGVNMIYGHNNSGKSNFLKFLSLLFQRKFPSAVQTRVDESRLGVVELYENEPISNFWTGIIRDVPYIFRNNDRKVNIKFEIIIEEDVETIGSLKFLEEVKKEYLKTERKFELKLVGEIVSRGMYDAEILLIEVLINGLEIYNSTRINGKYFNSVNDPKTKVTLTENGYEILEDLLGQFNDSVLLIDNNRYFTNEKENSKKTELSAQTFKNWIHNISLNPDRYNDLVDIVKSISGYRPKGDVKFNENEKGSPINNDFKFQFARVKEDLDLIFENSFKIRLPIESYGTGIQQILFLLAKVAEKRPRVILIEELELNLSPKYQFELVQHFLLKFIEDPNSRIKQLFFTTHSPNLCYRADFQIHNVTMNINGETELLRIGDKRAVIKEFYPAETIKLLIEQDIPQA